MEDDDDEEHVFLEPSAPIKLEVEETDVNDPRLRRLRAARENVVDQRHPGSDDEAEEDDRMSRHRRIHEPEVLSEGDEEQEDDEDQGAVDDDAQMDSDAGSTSGEEDLDEAGI